MHLIVKCPDIFLSAIKFRIMYFKIVTTMIDIIFINCLHAFFNYSEEEKSTIYCIYYY